MMPKLTPKCRNQIRIRREHVILPPQIKPEPREGHDHRNHRRTRSARDIEFAAAPNQPRMNAGVATNPVIVEMISASSGVIVSPTPRIIEVTSRNTKIIGVATSMIRA